MAFFILSRRHNEKVADLFVTYGEMFYNRAMQLVRDKPAAEDLAQNVMLELIKELEKGNPRACTLDDEHLRYYTLGILRNLHYQSCRKNKREAEKLEKLKKDLSKAGVQDMDEALRKSERLDLLERVVPQLPEHYYEFLMLKYIHNFGKEELAEALGVKVTSLPMIQKRTVDFLRKLIQKEEEAAYEG